MVHGQTFIIYHHLSMQYNIIILYNMYKYVYINIRIIYTIINSYMHAALKKGYFLS